MQTSFSHKVCSFRRPWGLKLAAIAALLTAGITPALAQVRVIVGGSPTPTVVKPKILPGTLVVPSSSQMLPADLGKRAHTNIRFIAPGTESPLEAPPESGYAYETPASLACIYDVGTYVAGCNPNTLTSVMSGGSQTIAIVDAYDDPEAPSDLAYFSDVFGLPFNFQKFQVVYQSGPGLPPAQDPTGGWELEESLDIEYAHAMAPGATIYLVEANSNYDSDLYTAIQIAVSLVQCGQTTTCSPGSTGKGEVSMSWGSAEFSGETSFDTYFSTGTSNVVFFASAGDSPGASYPSASPYVISVGGTSNGRSLATGNLISEYAWSDAGGGLSLYEPVPSYQSGNASVAAIAGTARATPDISADADPYTGVWVFDSFPVDGYFYSWWIVGGTSVASPTVAGIINNSETRNSSFAASTTAELTTLYNDLATPTTYVDSFYDVNYGDCNVYRSSKAATGYDLCTGLGVPWTTKGK